MVATLTPAWGDAAPTGHGFGASSTVRRASRRRRPTVKKLLLLVVLVALGAIVAKKVREA
jgi:hypothetical protein